MSAMKRLMSVKSIVTMQLAVTIATVLDLAIGFMVMATLVKVSTLITKKKPLILDSNFFKYMLADINECVEGADDCSQICTDTDGSYVCSCAPGYLLTNDSQGCDGRSYY